MPAATDTRRRLLDAATAVVRRDGARALTLDAAAAEAGVSKGGLLYHFKTKRELLEGMLDGWLEEFDAEIEAAREGRPFAHGYVKASDMSAWAAAERATEFGLLAAMVEEPGTLERVRARYAAWQEQLVREAARPRGRHGRPARGRRPVAERPARPGAARGRAARARDGADARARDGRLTDKSIGNESQ